MTRKELFDRIIDQTTAIHKEFAEYVAYCEKKTGVKYQRPETRRERAVDLLLYAVRRQMIMMHETLEKVMGLASTGDLKPPDKS